MIVNFEFLDEEPLENVITCMHHKVDKVIFFGYSSENRKRNRLRQFLERECRVKEIVFIDIRREDLQGTLWAMRTAIEKEREEGNQLFFDITGGENLILVAFGRLSKEYGLPIHEYDVVKDKLIELEDGVEYSISRGTEPQEVKLNLDSFIELQGGKIDYRKHKDIKSIKNEAFGRDIENIWTVAKSYAADWNPFSDYLEQKLFGSKNHGLSASRPTAKVRQEWVRVKDGVETRSLEELNAILDALAECGILTQVKHDEEEYAMTVKSREIRNVLLDGGCVLELHTYMQEKSQNDDCRVGVHIDWDGVIYNDTHKDVLNEIDVLTIKGNVANFISCKSGNMSLNYLYELETVSRRAGGKYAKKSLSTLTPIWGAIGERAKEMGIENIV